MGPSPVQWAPQPHPREESEIAATRKATADAQERIRAAFRALRDSTPGFRERKAQQYMMGQVANTFAAAETDDEAAPPPHVLLVEAGTGVGKSLGYLVPGIVAAQERDMALVVATGTVALQEQLVDTDLPKLARYSGLHFRAHLAKGRGRYFCPETAQGHLTEAAPESDLFGLAPSGRLTPENQDLLRRLYQAYTDETWSGDLDRWPETIPGEVRRRVTTTSTGCPGRHRCPSGQACPFYTDRDELEGADVVVANHDLVLADLALGGGVILPDPGSALYVLDEGHRLAARAREQFSLDAAVAASQEVMEGIGAAVQQAHEAIDSVDGASAPDTSGVEEALRGTGQGLQDAYRHLQARFEAEQPEDDVLRFELGRVDDGLQGLAANIAGPGGSALKTVRGALRALDNALEKAEGDALAGLNELRPKLTMAEERLANLVATWAAYTDPDPEGAPPTARWIQRYSRGEEVDFRVHAAPVSAHERLRASLWDRCAGAVVTSATLTSLGSFQRILADLGLTEGGDTHCLRLPSPFDYPSQGRLIVPRMASDPKAPAEHTREVIQRLPDYLARGAGSLVLFASRAQMEAVYEGLAAEWQAAIQCQGEVARDALLERHHAAVASGETAVIFGLASFAEGADLPGAACRSVVIAKLPFAVPTSPVEATRAEWVADRGGKPFFEIALPDASLKLIQAVGRLIRAEDDYGIVALLDNRLHTKGYGRDLLRTLPDFTRDDEGSAV